MAKIAHIRIDCCGDCPYAEDYPGMRRVELCTKQDGKKVKAEGIDDGCPLEDICTLSVKRA